MKKLFIPLLALCTFISVNAQDDCLTFFPNTPGAQLVNKTYNARGALLGTTTYTVGEFSENQSGNATLIRVAVTDSLNTTIDKGYIDVNCENGTFFIKQAYSSSLSPEIIPMLSMSTELLGDFMDYPDTFNDDYPFDSFKKDGGELILQSKSNKNEFVKIRIFNRQHPSNETITTPASTFNASKITFDFEVTKDKKTTQYKGTEWYAKNAGIVRSETRDANNNLLNYTELTVLKDK